MSTTLSEIRVIGMARGMKGLKYPEACPCCGKPMTFGTRWEALYECGARYSLKPQCQTHTDVYWGQCPTIIEGAEPLTPPAVELVGSEEADKPKKSVEKKMKRAAEFKAKGRTKKPAKES